LTLSITNGLLDFLILRIDNKLKTDGDPQALKKTAEVTETPKSTVSK
jgi:hypothetical protein